MLPLDLQLASLDHALLKIRGCAMKMIFIDRSVKTERYISGHISKIMLYIDANRVKLTHMDDLFHYKRLKIRPRLYLIIEYLLYLLKNITVVFNNCDYFRNFHLFSSVLQE